MGRWFWRVNVQLALLVLGARLGADGPATSGMRLDPEDAKALQATVQLLGDADFASRERAQRALEHLPPSKLESLDDYLQGTRNPEIISRLKSVEGKLAIRMPPVSLEVKNATLQEVAAALSTASGVSVQARQATDERFTLSVTNSNLWEIICRLSDQHVLGTNVSPGRVMLVPIDPTLKRYRQYEEGILFSVGKSPAAPTNGAFNFNLSMALDPRLQVQRAKLTGGAEVSDAHRHSLLLSGLRGWRLTEADGGSILSLGGLQLPTEFDDHVRIRGSITLVVPLKVQNLEFNDIEKHLNKVIVAGDLNLNVRQLISGPAVGALQALGMKVEAAPKGAKAQPPERSAMTIVNGRVRIDPLGGTFGDWTAIQGNTEISAGDEFLIDGTDRAGFGDMPHNIHGLRIGGKGIKTADDGNGLLGEMEPWALLKLVDADGHVALGVKVPRNLSTTTICGTQAAFKEPLMLVVSIPQGVVEVAVPFDLKNVPVSR